MMRACLYGLSAYSTKRPNPVNPEVQLRSTKKAWRLLTPTFLQSVTRELATVVTVWKNRYRGQRVLLDLGIDELRRVGMLELKGPISTATILYLIGWWLIFLVTALLPTWPGEPVIFFGAMLALAAAWLIAIPQVGDVLTRVDMNGLRPGRALWEKFRAAATKRKLELPPLSAADESQIADSLGGFVPAGIPLALLQVVMKVGVMAIQLAVVALVGLLVGPRLADVRVLWGWSPVSILYGMAAPWALILLCSLILPLLVQMYVLAVRFHRDIET
jgi:hypothetical protein